MRMRTLRRLRALTPRPLKRGEFDFSDATMEPDPGPPPEAVFDRSTGPFDRRRAITVPGAADEET
jgi:hypothetical protein